MLLLPESAQLVMQLQMPFGPSALAGICGVTNVCSNVSPVCAVQPCASRLTVQPSMSGTHPVLPLPLVVAARAFQAPAYVNSDCGAKAMTFDRIQVNALVRMVTAEAGMVTFCIRVRIG